MYINYDKAWAYNIISKLEKNIFVNENRSTALRSLENIDAFGLLVATILSQNTNDRNSIRAFKKLSENVGIEPYKIYKADIKLIEDSIRMGGLYRQKARAIKEISRIIIEHYNGDLNIILSQSLEKARKEMMSLPKIGYKTADIMLLFVANKPIFPVDTHITRVSKRLGIVSNNAKYEDIRRAWEKLLDPDQYKNAHFLLIGLGRKYCRARDPSCNKCPVKNLCNFYLSKT